jgi:hypothetical protein
MLHWTAAGDYRFKWVGTIQSTLTLRINGCSSNQSKGVTVNVYDASSTLIFSYYDSQTGNTTNMPFPSASGTGTIEIISDFPDRFSPVTAPITYSPGANNAGTFTFGVNTGYHCVAASGSLRYPCPDVLHWSDTTWGSITLNHGAGAGHSPLGPWWGQKSVVIGGTPTLINYNFGRLTFTSEYNIVVQRDTGGSVIGQWNLAFSSTSIAPASATGVDGGFNPGSTGTLNE